MLRRVATLSHVCRAPQAGLAIASLLLLSASCNEPNTAPKVSSNTNWLTACEVNADCSDALGCHCGACSLGCTTDQDCAKYPDTRCVLQAATTAAALCGSSIDWPSRGVCLPQCVPGDCGDDQLCALNACIPSVLPGSEFCSAVSRPDVERRRHEEELLMAVEQARANGGIDCGNGSVSSALPLLRVDARLTCAARVLAQDKVVTGSQGLTDAAGRSSVDRLSLATYPSRAWAEGYAIRTSEASVALQEMLADPQFCAGFTDPTLTDLGVGYVSNVYIVTMARQ